MKHVNNIIEHPAYKEALAEIAIREENRIFCRHNTDHFMNVARIAMILNLEEHREVDKDLIYATALLHDIGRHIQYDDKTPHEIASAEIAEPILKDCGFRKKEIQQIIQAILLHRSQKESQKHDLADVIYRADKLSRECYFCQASEICDWKKGKKNKELKY